MSYAPRVIISQRLNHNVGACVKIPYLCFIKYTFTLYPKEIKKNNKKKLYIKYLIVMVISTIVISVSKLRNNIHSNYKTSKIGFIRNKCIVNFTGFFDRT